jgi:hypothetical protein
MCVFLVCIALIMGWIELILIYIIVYIQLRYVKTKNNILKRCTAADAPKARGVLVLRAVAPILSMALIWMADDGGLRYTGCPQRYLSHMDGGPYSYGQMGAEGLRRPEGGKAGDPKRNINPLSFPDAWGMAAGSE